MFFTMFLILSFLLFWVKRRKKQTCNVGKFDVFVLISQAFYFRLDLCHNFCCLLARSRFLILIPPTRCWKTNNDMERVILITEGQVMIHTSFNLELNREVKRSHWMGIEFFWDWFNVTLCLFFRVNNE
jgi:hypothetical protein